MSSNTYPPNDSQPEEADENFEGAPQLDDHELTAELESELADLNERVLRLAAEVENTRRRGEREKQDASRYAIAAFARDLIAVADNLERALATAPADADAANAESVSSFVTGVRLTERALASALERHGVKKIDPKGEKFDPNRHQAVAQAPSPDVPAGHVAETAQSGFVIGERVLRAAMVVVSTGAAAPAAGAHVDTQA